LPNRHSFPEIFEKLGLGVILVVLDCSKNLRTHSKSLRSALIKPTSSDTAQTPFLLPDLEKRLDSRRLLYRLAQFIDWKGFEKIFGSLYSAEGPPALPIRKRCTENHLPQVEKMS
jgi:hypothetical protein